MVFIFLSLEGVSRVCPVVSMFSCLRGFSLYNHRLGTGPLFLMEISTGLRSEEVRIERLHPTSLKVPVDIWPLGVQVG